MHYIIGLITALAGLLWALNSLQRSGFKPSSLNPFAWYRRFKWGQKYSADPVTRVQDPLELVTVLLMGMAKCEGEVSRDQKQAILSLLQEEVGVAHDEAPDLMVLASYLTKDETYISDKIDNIVARVKSKVTTDQVESILAMMTKIGTIDGELNVEQRQLIEATAKALSE